MFSLFYWLKKETETLNFLFPACSKTKLIGIWMEGLSRKKASRSKYLPTGHTLFLSDILEEYLKSMWELFGADSVPV